MKNYLQKFIDEELSCIADIESKPNGTIICWWVDDDKSDYNTYNDWFGGKTHSDYQDGCAWYGLEWSLTEIFYIMQDLFQKRSKAGYKPYREYFSHGRYMVNGFFKWHYEDWNNRKYWQKV